MSREAPEQRAERLTAELREASREAAGVLKDLLAAMRQARHEVDEYLHDECQRALDENTKNLINETARMVAEHEKKVIDRVIGYSALIEANFGREPLIREAAARIEKLVMAEVDARHRLMAVPAPGVVISVCDRPHAD